MKLTITRFKNISDGTIGKFELCEADERGVYDSKKTLEAFMERAKNKPLTVEIINKGV